METLVKITGEGNMKNGCDICPKDSIQFVSIDENGVRWTREGRDAIHPDISSVEVSHLSDQIQKCCNTCKNFFILEAVFHEGTCDRCYKRMNGIPRD